MPSDPRLTKVGIESIWSTIHSLREDAREAQKQVDDPHARQALISLDCAVDLLSVLVRISLEPYMQGLEDRGSALSRLTNKLRRKDEHRTPNSDR